MAQCNSGGFIDNFQDKKSVILTACGPVEFSYRADNDDPDSESGEENEMVDSTRYYHSEFNYHVINAIRGKTFVGYSLLYPGPDLDKNGFVSLDEIQEWEFGRDSQIPYYYTPQYYAPGSLGAISFLNPLVDLAASSVSISNTAAAWNSQRKLYRESSGKLHEVFESGSEVFYRNSTDAGSSWAATTRLSDGLGGHNAPCIAMASTQVLVAWQSGSGDYGIRIRRSTNGGTTWLTTQNIATSVECVDPGPLPSVSGYSDGSAFIAYRDQTDERIRCKNSTDAGASWSTISATPQTNLGSHMPSCGIYTTPSSTIQANLVHANGEPAANRIYYNYYDFSTSAWGTATNLSSILPGQYSDFTDPSIGQSTNFRTLHIAWDAFDENSENRVIVYREGGFRSFASEYSVIQHEGAQKPSITGTFDEEAWVVYQDESGIWKRWYDGSYWDYESYVGDGFDAQASVGSASAKYLWTSGSASPYQVNLSSETLNKPGAGPTYSRALNLIDTARGSSVTIELGRMEVVRKDGAREPIMFARSPGDTLQLDVRTLCDAGSTVAFVLPEDADSLCIEYSVYGTRAKELFVEETGNVGFLVLNSSRGATLTRVGTQKGTDIAATKPIWLKTSLPVSEAPASGVTVQIRPEITGLKDLPLLASLGHIYGRSEGGTLQKVHSQRQIPISATEVPGRFELEQSYPNPFNPSTTLRYRLAAPGLVRLTVFDILGREVAVLMDGQHEAGIHTASWDAAGVSSGMYMARLTVTGSAGETLYTGTRKLLLAK